MTKIKHTEIYNNSEEKHIVVRGKIVFVESSRKKAINSTGDFPLYNSTLKKWFNPIAISETEDFKGGDNVIDIVKRIWINMESCFVKAAKGQGGAYKILALPEQFSTEDLQDIIDGKLKDGDEVYVECKQDLDEYYKPSHAYLPMTYLIKLTNNTIKLFPANKENKITLTKEELITFMKDCELGTGSWSDTSYKICKFVGIDPTQGT